MSLQRLPVNERTTEQQPNAQQLFISQNVNLITEWGKEKQTLWANFSLLALQRCDAWLESENHPKSLQDIYYFLANERFKIARLLGHEILYGLPRISDSIKSPFTSTRLRTRSQYTQIEERFLSMPKNSTGEVVYKLFLNGIKKSVLKISQDKKGELNIIYPSIGIMKEIMEEASKIWLDLFACKDHLSVKDKYFQLGKILWHLAIARPLEFGSASVSENLYHTLAKQIGLSFVALHCGNRTWDVWAIFHSTSDEFAHWFCAIAEDNLLTTPHFTLPKLDIVDNTSTIENEAKRIISQPPYPFTQHDWYDEEKLDEINGYRSTHLVDPYGFGLYHHYNMILIKQAVETKYGLTDVSSRLSGKVDIDLSCKMMINGQVLFLEALHNSKNNIDPIIFMMNKFDKKSSDIRIIEKHTNIITITVNLLSDIDNLDAEIPDEIKRKFLLNLLDYVALTFKNDEIKQLANTCKTLIQHIDGEGDLFYEIGLILKNDNSARLFNLIKVEKPYNDVQLMKLIEIADCEGIETYFMNLCVKDWLVQRANEKGFIDSVLDDDNNRLMIFILKSITCLEDLYDIMNHVANRGENSQLDFFFYHLINFLSISELKEKVKPWLDQRPDINLFSLIFDNINPLKKPIENLLSVLFGNITADKIREACEGSSIVACALRIQDVSNRAAVIEFIMARGVNLAIPYNVDAELMVNIQRYIYTSHNINVCRYICKQLEQTNFLKMISANVKYSNDFNNCIINFCTIINEFAANSKAVASPLLFSTKPSNLTFREAVFEEIHKSINPYYPINFDRLKIYFSHIDFFTQDDLKKFKEALKKVYLSDNSIITIIDKRMKNYSTSFNL